MSSVSKLTRAVGVRFGTAALTALSLSAVAPAMANPVYLVGAQVYSAGEDGSNRAGPFQYSTNASTSHYNLLVTDAHGDSANTALSLQLVEGDNAFTFAFQSASLSTPIVGLNLFFSSIATPYDPAYQPGIGIAGNLTVFAAAGFAGFGAPGQGVDVASFSNDGLSTNATAYSGATFFEVGDETIDVSRFSATNAPSGSFTLTVRPAATDPGTGTVPEPASVALLAIGIVGLGAIRIGRRRTRPACTAHAIPS